MVTCNIDARGKAVRMGYGVVMLVGAAAVTLLILFSVMTAWWWWLVAGGLFASGVFAVYEARKGWCVVRAMGFRTPV